MKNKVFGSKASASAENTFILGNARFQWLTPEMVRLEWHEEGLFEDRPTMAVLNRNFPKVTVKKTESKVGTVLKSSALTLTYKDDGKPFHSGNLNIQFTCAGKKTVWKPGMKDKANLGGTIRTLDLADGNKNVKNVENPYYKEGASGDEGKKYLPVFCEIDLGQGLVSKNGWSLVDDSRNIVITELEDGRSWVEPRPEGERVDWYFLGYGHDYKSAVRDAAEVFGRQPLPPRYAFGYWWSRYWAYSDKELEALAESFDAMNVPIDVMVIDMDWHLPGWTGYSWDRNYFPDPAEFLANLKERGLKVSLNLHPADGVAKFEDQFEDMAKAMGQDPKKTDRVKFDITDPKYMKNYFEILHHPDEKRGIDFWWMDWQQGESTDMPGLDTLPWINHLHWQDMLDNPERKGKRPLIFSRFGGIGAGRYCIGFSGDTYSNWESLKYQPYFTSTAANVLYGYWSHDIGGHMPGAIDPELYTRWMQFGMFSPILRTHTTKNYEAERRVWEYPDPYNQVMMDVIRRRYEMVPYIYSECRKSFDKGMSLCCPMYYEYPEEKNAYNSPDQYMFGSEMLVAPVVQPADKESELAEVSVWLPKGEWFDTARGCMEQGGKVIRREYLLQEVPVFVRPGTIIPGQKNAKRLDSRSINDLVLTVYPGKEGSYTLYEDDGISSDYENDKSASIEISHKESAGKKVISIAPVKETYPGFCAKKNIEIRLPGMVPPESVKCGKIVLDWTYREKANCWRYDGDTATTIISLEKVDLAKGLEIAIKQGKGELINGFAGIMARLERIKYYNTLITRPGVLHDDERIGIELSQIGNRISRNPEVMAEEVKRLKKRIKDLPKFLNFIMRGEDKMSFYQIPNQKEFCGIAIALTKHVRKLIGA